MAFIVRRSEMTVQVHQTPNFVAMVLAYRCLDRRTISPAIHVCVMPAGLKTPAQTPPVTSILMNAKSPSLHARQIHLLNVSTHPEVSGTVMRILFINHLSDLGGP